MRIKPRRKGEGVRPSPDVWGYEMEWVRKALLVRMDGLVSTC